MNYMIFHIENKGGTANLRPLSILNYTQGALILKFIIKRSDNYEKSFNKSIEKFYW